MSVSLLKDPALIPAAESEGYLVELPSGEGFDVYYVRPQPLCGPGYVTLHGQPVPARSGAEAFVTLPAGQAVRLTPAHYAPAPVALAWME